VIDFDKLRMQRVQQKQSAMSGLHDEIAAAERNRQIKKSTERLNLLERLEKQRQLKLEQELK